MAHYRNLIGLARPPTTESDNPPLLVLLHGLGSDERDLMGLADELPANLYVASLRAPFETGYGGYSWFTIEFYPDGQRRIDSDEALSSRDTLISELELLPERLGLNPSKMILGGFSQGAMMASGVLLDKPELVDAAWLMSGRILPAFDSGLHTSHPRPVLSQHGLFDEVITIDEGRELASVLEKRGHLVASHEYPMAHEINFSSLKVANEWLRELTRTP